MTRLTIPSEEVLGENYTITNITASNYNPKIDSTVTVTVTVTDVYGDPVANKYVTTTCNIGKFTKLNNQTISDTQSVTAQTDSNGEISLTYTCSEWGLVTFSANNTSTQVRVLGWKTIQSVSNYTVLANGEFVRIDFKQGSNATVPQSYDYTLPNGYYPKYPVAAISSTIGDDGIHYASFKVDVSGNLSVVLRRNTYNTSVNTIYGQLMYLL